MSIIQAAGSGEVSTGFYNLLLDQSLKFNPTEAQYLRRTPAAAGNRRLFTLSIWFKRTAIGVNHNLFGAGASGASYFLCVLGSNDKLTFETTSSGSQPLLFVTTQLFRDTSAWYHLVIAIDTAQSTNTNRVKFYLNGSQITAFDSASYPSQNYDFEWWTTAIENQIGMATAAYQNTSGGFNGYMADICYLDGTAALPASFGETKDGIWTPKDTSGLTFGTNGFHLTFKDDVVSEGFNTVTYTGNDSANSISGIGFSPDFVWLKQRNASENHFLTDSVRGAGLHLRSDATTAESDTSATFTAFDGDGFSLTGSGSAAPQINDDGDTYVGWCWEAGGAPTADNSANAGATPTAGSVKIDGSNLGSALGGSIAATRLSANTTKGFSVGTFTKGSGTQTVAHGLGAAPDWLLVKRRNGSGSWIVYHSANTANPETDYLTLNSTNATADEATFWNDTAPTSTVFTVGTAFNSGETLVFYAWTDISGYSKFGSYTGNGSTTGPTVTTGFSPAWVMYKRTSGTGDWGVLDNTRDPANPISLWLGANIANAESHEATRQLNFLSTGFQPTGTNSDVNADGDTYIYMAFADTRSAAFFKDVSTNGNNFTPVNLDYRDSVPDTPTNNFNTTNVLSKSSYVDHSNGNLTVTGNTATNNGNYLAFPRLTSGKYYYEQYIKIVSSYPYFIFNVSSDAFYYSNGGSTWPATSNVRISAASGGGFTGLGASTGDIIGIAVDLDSGTKTVKIYKNNSLLETINITTSDAGIGMAEYNGSFSVYNFGQDSSFAGLKATSNANADGNGHGSFAYAPPSGYLALCSQNLPDVEIIDGTENFVPYVYTANNASTRDFTGIGFAPNFLWFKDRTTAFSHALYDTVRGVNKGLQTNGTGAENSYTVMTAFGDDGFSTGTDAAVAGNILNYSTDSYVVWAWLAGTAFSNSAGANGATIASSGQVNTTAGFSIVKYTGNTTAGATVAHGLSSAPQFIITKNRDASTAWHVYYGDATDYLVLNTTAATADSAASGWNDVAPTSSVFSLGASNPSNANQDIAYCFHSVEGYSKVGSYTGNGNADGPFVFTGFRPAWIMVKKSSSTEAWWMVDSVRETTNPLEYGLQANDTAAELSPSKPLDFLSNGFKPRVSTGYHNDSGATYIYLAFADQPFKFSNAF